MSKARLHRADLNDQDEAAFSKIRSIDDLTGPPVPGQHYLVPHVLYWWTPGEPIYGRTQDARWWPIIGPKHDDIEHLNFKAKHYHCDVRFLRRSTFSDRRRNIRASYSNLVGTPISEFSEREWYGHKIGGPLPEPVWRTAKCIVADAGFVPHNPENLTFVAFHAAYEGKRCRRDAEGRLICPHKGAPLNSLAPDRKGRVVCPLHGLLINVETGVVEKRPTVARMVL
jgi:hypothetical protein